MNLTKGRYDPRLYWEPHYVDGRWVSEIAAAGPGDVVPPRFSLVIRGRHVLNFRGTPPVLHLDYRLTAEGMQTRKGVIRIGIDWSSHSDRRRLEEERADFR